MMSPREIRAVGPGRQRDLVREGYDAISFRYKDDHGRPGTEPQPEWALMHEAWIEELATMLSSKARVLDLGCGAGVPADRLLVGMGFEVVGLDFSRVQIERARRLIPKATFVEADMAAWDTDPESFDAVVSFYALIHVPLDDQRALFPRIRRWLREGGLLMAIVGAVRWTGVEDYYGAPMFWDHADTATYLRWLREVGLEPLWSRFVPEGESGHTLLLARAVETG